MNVRRNYNSEFIYCWLPFSLLYNRGGVMATRCKWVLHTNKTSTANCPGWPWMSWVSRPERPPEEEEEWARPADAMLQVLLTFNDGNVAKNNERRSGSSALVVAADAAAAEDRRRTAAADKMEGKPRAKFPLHEFVIAKTFFPFVSSIGMQKSSNRRVETRHSGTKHGRRHRQDRGIMPWFWP